ASGTRSRRPAHEGVAGEVAGYHLAVAEDRVEHLAASGLDLVVAIDRELAQERQRQRLLGIVLERIGGPGVREFDRAHAGLGAVAQPAARAGPERDLVVWSTGRQGFVHGEHELGLDR